MRTEGGEEGCEEKQEYDGTDDEGGKGKGFRLLVRVGGGEIVGVLFKGEVRAHDVAKAPLRKDVAIQGGTDGVISVIGGSEGDGGQGGGKRIFQCVGQTDLCQRIGSGGDKVHKGELFRLAIACQRRKRRSASAVFDEGVFLSALDDLDVIRFGEEKECAFFPLLRVKKGFVGENTGVGSSLLCGGVPCGRLRVERDDRSVRRKGRAKEAFRCGRGGGGSDAL